MILSERDIQAALDSPQVVGDLKDRLGEYGYSVSACSCPCNCANDAVFDLSDSKVKSHGGGVREGGEINLDHLDLILLN